MQTNANFKCWVISYHLSLITRVTVQETVFDPNNGYQWWNPYPHLLSRLELHRRLPVDEPESLLSVAGRIGGRRGRRGHGRTHDVTQVCKNKMVFKSNVTKVFAKESLSLRLYKTMFLSGWLLIKANYSYTYTKKTECPTRSCFGPVRRPK